MPSGTEATLLAMDRVMAGGLGMRDVGRSKAFAVPCPRTYEAAARCL